MTNPKNVLLKLTHFHLAKSFRTSAALMLITLILVVAALTTVATAQTYTVLYNFDGTHGANPYHDRLAEGRDGNLYGTTPGGGANGGGVLFRITPDGKLKVLYNFDGVHGFNPWGLTLGTDGNFYGSTARGGDIGWGTIFKTTKNGALTTLYSFTGGTDGAEPDMVPIQGADGNFYGTTIAGTAYKITPSGGFTLLDGLPGASYAPLLQATGGDLYGTTADGGNRKRGTVFKLTPKGKMTIVYKFDGVHGQDSWAGLIQGNDGYFYGTTYFGGSKGSGVVFKLTPQGAIRVLHNFPDPNYPNDGSLLLAGLVQATDGTFYGVTVSGGTFTKGAIFQVTAAGAYSILYNFDATHGGYNSSSTPMQHTNGKIYGLTSRGGTTDQGVVYSFDVGLGPFARLVSTWGKVGKTVEILGQGFTGTTAVSFNGAPATFTVVSDTYLEATVPSGATTGYVTVTTPGGTLKSNQEFRIKP